MKAAIVSHGEIKDYGYIGKIMRECDMLVCADGGCEHALKCDLIPDALVGDLDSIGSETLLSIENSRCEIVRYPVIKDYTDTELAVDYALRHGAGEIVLLGSTGDRLDHSLANIFLLVKMCKCDIKASIINEKNSIYITKDFIKLKGKPGDLLSLLPIGGDAEGIYTEGLQYKLDGESIKMGDPLGVSNVFIDNEITVKLGSGMLLVIKSMD